MKIKEVLGKNGCSGCIYNFKQGAKKCGHSKYCIAHLRSDKKSIIFKYDNE